MFVTSAPGCVQPAAGWPVPAGAVPVTAVPGLDGHARALELLLLLLEQPSAVRAAATTSAAPAITDRRGPVILALLLMANPSIGQHQGGLAGPGRVRGGTIHIAMRQAGDGLRGVIHDGGQAPEKVR